MAGKKIEPIISLGNVDKLVVQKSLPLFSLWRSELSLAEFKILDTYLSRIDSHKPDKRTVVFSKGELEKLLGVKRIRIEELDERLKNLGTPIKFQDSVNSNKKFARISLFEKSIAEQDDNGLWQIELTASQSAMKYFFNIENLGYLRYKLRCITSLTSRYTYIMFIYLEANRFRKTWEVDLEELRKILNCDQEETYQEYKRFNDRLLKRVQKEMHEKTECRYTYEPVKDGRSVVAICFTLETLPKIDFEDNIDQNQLSIIHEQTETLANTDTELWQSAISDFNFTNEQVAQLREVLFCIPEEKLPQSPACYGVIELMRYHYMQINAAEIRRRTNIKNRFAYLLKIMKQDANI